MHNISNNYPLKTDILAKGEISLSGLAEIVESIAFELAGEVPTVLCSELILISARLEQISQQFRQLSSGQ